jgi:hypothetical protein
MTCPPQALRAGVDIASVAIREVRKISRLAPQFGQEPSAAGEAIIRNVR